MAAFTTVPAEEEPLVETTSKPKSLKRLVAGAAAVLRSAQISRRLRADHRVDLHTIDAASARWRGPRRRRDVRSRHNHAVNITSCSRAWLDDVVARILTARRAQVSLVLGAVAATSLRTALGTPVKIEMDQRGACPDQVAEPFCDEYGGVAYYRDDDWNLKAPTFMESVACTPYGYAPHPPSSWGGDLDEYDDSDPFTKIMLLGYPNKQGVWGTKHKDEFFVFHGSDGSGVQSDCVGDNWKYAERFGRPATGNEHGEDPDGKLDENGQLWEWLGGKEFNDVMPGEGFCWIEDYSDVGAGSRQYCHFGHPGARLCGNHI